MSFPVLTSRGLPQSRSQCLASFANATRQNSLDLTPLPSVVDFVPKKTKTYSFKEVIRTTLGCFFLFLRPPNLGFSSHRAAAI